MVAEKEVPPFDQAAGLQSAKHDAVEELAGLQPQEGRVGRIGQHGLDAQLGQQLGLALGPAAAAPAPVRDAAAAPDADRT